MIEKFKDVELAGVKYRVSRMTPCVGSWVVSRIAPKLMLGIGMVDGKPSMSMGAIGSVLQSFTEAEFMSIQAHSLAVCSTPELVGTVEAAIPVLTEGGTFTNPELECDLVTVFALSIHALIFNVAPFFTGDALTQTLLSFKGLSLLDAPKSMNT